MSVTPSSSPAAGAVCAAGMQPADILAAVRDGHVVDRTDPSSGTPRSWPTHIAGEIADLNPRALVDDRKLHKLIRRTDLVGLYAAGRAIEQSRASSRIATPCPHAAAARLQRPQRRDRRLGRRQLPEPVRLLSADDEAEGRPAAFGRELSEHRQPDVAAAHAARTTCSATSASSTASRAPTPASPTTASAARWP